ncbi:MAG TPA: flavin reductase family protein [Trebonia sp.]|nr:flavin reductase family protein [Trebonia sp.]
MDDQLIPNGSGVPVSGPALHEALSAWAAGVTLVTIADDRDDLGTTVSAFIPVSLDPPLVAVSLIAGSYPAEVLSRPSLPAGWAPDGKNRHRIGHPSGPPPGGRPPVPPAMRFAVTLLSSSQKVLAGQFAAEGRPSARLILEGTPHVRGASSGALIPSGGLAALECSVARRVPAGDHLLVICAVENVAYVAESGSPLVRFRGRYPAL